MQFNQQFARWVGEGPDGSKELGVDERPAHGDKATAEDFVFDCRSTNVNGFPIQRVVVSYAFEGGDGVDAAPELPVEVWAYEDLTRRWYCLSEPGATLRPDRFTYFDPPTPCDNQRAGHGSAGTITVALLVGKFPPGQAWSAPRGKYVFAFCGDVSNPA